MTTIKLYFGIIDDKGKVVDTDENLADLERRLYKYPNWYQIQERHVLIPGNRIGAVHVIKKSEKNIKDEEKYKNEALAYINLQK